MGNVSYPQGKHRLEVEFQPEFLYEDDLLKIQRKRKYTPIQLAIHVDLDKFFEVCHRQGTHIKKNSRMLPYFEFESEQPIPAGRFNFILPYKGTQVIFSDVRIGYEFNICKVGYEYSSGNWQWIML